jgi:4-amino-4-deoxy-L-arabinose transferase-like glycosyltransferase
VALKVILLAADVVPFNSDEAVVGLMARHILRAGERPTFFYGQAYMGSLDAWLVAGAFALLGESVTAIRVAQATLFAGTLVMTYLLARRCALSEWGARVAALLMALPPVMVTLYTTVSLGGYGETLLLGTTALALALRLAGDYALYPLRERLVAWMALGLVGGLAFWVLGQAAVYLLPAAILLAWRLRAGAYRRWRAWRGVVVAAIAFVAASSPWWLYDLSHQHAALYALMSPSAPGPGTSLVDRAVGLVLLGLPALCGLRFPWRPDYLPLPVVFPALVFYLAVAVYAARPSRVEHRTAGRTLLLLMVAVFVVVFVISRFGLDATGRYLLPLAAPLVIFTAMLLEAMRTFRPWLATSALVAIVAFNLWGAGVAATSPDKITTQFGPATRFDNSADKALVDFLLAHGGQRGYANYWVSFRLAFESGEEIILAPLLPYRENLRVAASDNRYPQYTEAVARAERVVYVTVNQPELDKVLRERFSSMGITFSEEIVGPYRVFYELARKPAFSVQGY